MDPINRSNDPQLPKKLSDILFPFSILLILILSVNTFPSRAQSEAKLEQKETIQSLDQSSIEEEIWVTIVRQGDVPTDKSGRLQSSSSEIQTLIDQFDIISVEAALPDSRREDLKKVYSMKCQCSADELIAKIETISTDLELPVLGPKYELLFSPNDYNSQFTQDYALDLIDAQGAWDYSIGDTSIILGISDGNFYLNHEDLQNQYVNTNTWNSPPNYYYHGTAVAVTAAGTTNNSIGKSSIGYDCKMSLNGMSYNSILQMTYAGAKVINISWASSCFNNAYSQTVMDEVYNNGTIVVAAAGNGGTCSGPNNLVYPAAHNHVIAVSSIGPNDNHEKIIGDPNTTHQHNSSVDICAPGYDVPLTIAPGNYTISSGTSFAAPLVTGTIGLMLALNPCLTFEDVENILYSTAVNIDAENPNYIGDLGAGRLDAKAALEMVYNSMIHSTSSDISCIGMNDGAIDLQNIGANDICSWSTLNGAGLNSLSQNQSGLSAGTYFVTVTDDNGCSMSDTMILNEPAAWVDSSTLNIFPSGHNISCYGGANGSIDLEISNGVSGFSYQWTHLDGSLLSTFPNSQDQTGLTAGEYIVTVMDSMGCTLIDTFNVSQPTALFITHDLEIYPSGDHISCYGQSDGEIDITVTGGCSNYSFVWSGVNSAVINVSDEDQTGLSAGTYFIEVQDNNGCQYFDSITLTEPSAMVTDISVLSDYYGLPISCSGTDDGSILASVTGGSSGYSYLWNNTSSQNSAQLNDIGEGHHEVTIVDSNGCIITDSITLQGHNLPALNPSSSIDVCPGELVTFTSNSEDTESCFWQLSNGMELDQCGPNTLLFDEAQCLDATLTITNEYGCSDSMLINNYICVHPNPVADFEANDYDLTIVDNIAYFTNYSSGASEYEWNFGDNTFDTGEDVSHTYETMNPNGFEVELTAYSEFGCWDTTTRIIQVKDELLFYVPNAFTPDGDEYNNVFLPQFGSGFSPNDYALNIYNRWGEIVFESQDLYIGWDGTFNGQIAPDGAYSWRMTLVQNNEVLTTNATETYTGNVVLLR